MDLSELLASDGVGDAALARVSANRLALATTLAVDTVANWPAKFIATSGTLLPSGYIDPATKLEFKGHLSGGNIIIDSFEPGFTDVGNTQGQAVVLRPSTGFVNELIALLQVVLNNNGTLKSDIVTTAKILDANVTTAKIADANVTDAKVAAGIAAEKINSISGEFYVSADSVQPGNAGGAWTKANIDSYVVNNGGFVISGGRITVPKTGKYLVNWTAVQSDSTTTAAHYILAGIGLNDNTAPLGTYWDQAFLPSNIQTGAKLTRVMNLTAGDILSFWGYSDQSGATNWRFHHGAAGFCSKAEIAYLGA